MSKIDEAQERLAAEAERAPKEGGPDKAKKEDVPDPVEPKGRPEYLKELTFCRVAITIQGFDGEDHVVVADPGFKHVERLGGIFSEDAERRGLAYTALTKAMRTFTLPSISDSEELGVEEGDELPDPREFLRDHTNAWEKWRKAKRKVERQAVQAARRDPDTEFPEPPDPPETTLQHLYEECMPSRALLRISEGINWAINPSPEEGPGN